VNHSQIAGLEEYHGRAIKGGFAPIDRSCRLSTGKRMMTMTTMTTTNNELEHGNPILPNEVYQ
jgi:hypothetical protein